MTNSRSALRTTQMRYCCWNLVSTPNPKSPGYAARKIVGGSNMVLGRKKRRNIRKLTARKPPIAVQVMRRRILFTGSGGGSLWTVLLFAPALDPTPARAAVPGPAAALAAGFAAGGLGFTSVLATALASVLASTFASAVVGCFSSASTFGFSAP